MSILQLMEQLRERVEEEVVECPVCAEAKRRGFDQLVFCDHCHKEGKVPNPAYDALREMVRVKCPCKHGTAKTWIVKEQRYVWICVDCKATGYISRSFEEWPKGALAGALAYVGVYMNWPRSIRKTLRESFWEADPDLAAVQAVLEALS